MIGHVDTPSNGQPTIGRPFYGQAKGQLRLTCAFYAECAHEGSKGAKGAEGSKGCGGRPSEKRGASMKKPYKRPGGRWKSVPLFGGAAPKGVHFLERSEVVRLSLPPGNIHTHRREAAIPSPLNPMNLLNPDALRACPSPPERSEYNLWHRGPSGPMDAIRPSAP